LKERSGDSGRPPAGTLAPPQRGVAALDARPYSPAFGGNLARSSSRRPAVGLPESPSDSLEKIFSVFWAVSFRHKLWRDLAIRYESSRMAGSLVRAFDLHSKGHD